MKTAPLYIVDNFTDKPYRGNPAAVCILEDFPEDNVMLSIADENRYSETAFLVQTNERYYLRWFTPTTEVSLCGHATLATAYVLFEEMGVSEYALEFHTQSGVLTVWREKHAYTMKFPARKIAPVDLAAVVEQCIGAEVLATHSAGPTVIAEVSDESTVENLEPDIDQIEKSLDYNGLIVTATGERVDFVSRFFGPRVGIPEDPVTGSAHCGLAPYWAERLQKHEFSARQLSKRGGKLKLRLEGEDVYIGGQCVLYSRGEVLLRCG